MQSQEKQEGRDQGKVGYWPAVFSHATCLLDAGRSGKGKAITPEAAFNAARQAVDDGSGELPLPLYNHLPIACPQK